MSRVCIVLLFAAFQIQTNAAMNLRSAQELSLLQTHKEISKGEDPIPDPTCKKGVMSPDMKVCCTDECGSCGNHKLCSNVGKYNEATGKLADNCCKDRIQEKEVSCDTNHPPCVLSASYKESINNFVIDRPKRHAMDDCTKAVPIARAKHAMGIEKGEFFAKLHVEVKTKYEDAQAIAVKVMGLCEKKTAESNGLVDGYVAKIASASAADKVEDAMTGVSQVNKWADARDGEKAEVVFYNMITKNAKDVDGLCTKGLTNVRDLRVKAEKVNDVAEFVLELTALVDDAQVVFTDAQGLWQQWQDSSKDYSCGVPPSVNHAESQCKDGNTKYGRKCAITCGKGYDGKGTRNALRCNKQGKFGKQLYGEWAGMASCVGRSCGHAPKIDKSKTVIQDIRYPHTAAYICHEGFSTTRDVASHSAFNMQCGPDGNFEQNASQVCKAISCGNAPAMRNSHPLEAEFRYTEVATYDCLTGFTSDGTPGGVKGFSRTCQATGKFTEGLGCTAVRCGLPPSYDHTTLDKSANKTSDQFYADELKYECKKGYTLDQKAGGVDHFTLSCQADGEFALLGTAGDVPLPKCRPVSAGMAPKIAHGNFNPREMFFGESALVAADSGWSTSSHPTEGWSFTLSVTADGTYEGEEKFLPVDCGKPPAPAESQTTFNLAKASFGDLLNYKCNKGFSWDKSTEEASGSFSVSCEADGDFSAVPGLGLCANIDDCADHTCGPHGNCIDHVANYTCDCHAGYEQNRDAASNELVCGNINDCGPEACGVGQCEDLVEGYKCKCPEGYEELHSRNDEGKMDHTCKAVECGIPPEVENSATTPVELQLQKAYYQAHIGYQCDLGFTLDATAVGKNHFGIDCKSNKEFTATKACKAIKCGAVPEVNHSKAVKASAIFNESVRFDCDKGHTVDGTAGGDHGFTVTCLVTGQFGEPQACKPVSCGEPDSLTNANRDSGPLFYEDTITYNCFNGFTLDGSKEGSTSFTSTCHEDGKLDSLKQCVPKICGEPPIELAGVLYASTKDEGNIRYPQSTTIICRDGYTVGGDAAGATEFVVHCLASGEFEKVDERRCMPVKCGAPPAMANATLARIVAPEASKPGLTRNAYFVTVDKDMPNIDKKVPHVTDTVSNINDDFKKKGYEGRADHFVVRYSGALMIKKEGEYKFQLTSDDGSFLYINGEKVVDNGGLHGMKEVSGTVSYLHEGPHALTVDFYQKGGGAGVVLQWKGPDSGGNMEIVPESAFQTKGGNLNFEEKAMYKCDMGFTTGGEYNAPTEFKVECLASGEISYPAQDMQCRNVDDCEQHTCGPKGQCIDLVGAAPAYNCSCDHGYEITTNADGEKHCGNIDDCQGKDCGVGVCKDLVGDYTCQCPSGYYIGFKDGHKTCAAVECLPDTPSVDNGRLLSDHSGIVDFPTTLRYKCDVGYSVDGSVSESKRNFQAQCKSDSELFGMMSCQKISCGTPHVVPFTNLLSPETVRRSVDYNDKAKYECLEGYTIGGQPGAESKFEVKCQDDGVLTDPQTCEPVKCGIAPRVSNARAGIAGDVFFGQNLIYRCDLGHTLDSTPQGRTEFGRECNEDGSFSDLEMDEPCQAVSAGNAPTIADADLQEVAGSNVEITPVEVFYPNGIEYRCKPGYSTNGAPSGPTKISSRVNSLGRFSPALPSRCNLITYTIRGYIKNARNGAMLTGVKVTVGNNPATSSYGAYTLGNVGGGAVTLNFELAGFITVSRQVTVTGDIACGGVGDIGMSPEMQNDQWRSVVKWGRSPSDLDSYAKWGTSKVCWYGSRASSNGITGKLELDKTSGYGPETVYLSDVGSCRGGSSYCDIKYMVNDYTGSGSMLREGQAEVTLYNGDHVAGTWKITDCARSVTNSGNWWHVFTLDATTNRLKWSCDQGALLQMADIDMPDGPSKHSQNLTLPASLPSLKIRRISQ